MTELAVLGGPPAVTLPHHPPWPQLSHAARARVDGLLDRSELSDYGYGDTIAEFERTVAEYHGVRHALGFSSGTAALHAAYFGAGVGPGDEVIVPSYSFHATVAPLFLLSAVPVLCDVDPLTGNVDLEDAEHRVTDATRAIAVTHLWGHPVDADGLRRLADRHGLRVVEDGSHAHGARYRGRLAGTLGDVAVFSLGARKMVSGGLAGVMLTDDPDVYLRALLVGHCHERAEVDLPAREVAVGLGGNYHMSPVAAAICIEQYADLDRRIAVKTAVLEGLGERLRGLPGVHPQHTDADVSRGGWYGYKARYEPEELDGLPLDTFVCALRAEGLLVDRPSNRPLHWQDMFQRADLEPAFYRSGRPRPLYGTGDLPGAERYYASSLSFPATRLHEPCDELLDQYREGIQKVVENRDRLDRVR